MFKQIAAIALALFAVGTQAQTFTKDEQDWMQAIAIFAADAKAMGMPYEVERIVGKVGEVSPVAADYKNGKCIIRLSVRGNPYSQAVQDMAEGPAGAAVARVASMAHEFGHCVHARALEAGEELPPTHSAQSEAMADVYALIWIKGNAPSHMQTALGFFRKLRANSLGEKYSLSLQAIEKVAALEIGTASPVTLAAATIK